MNDRFRALLRYLGDLSISSCLSLQDAVVPGIVNKVKLSIMSDFEVLRQEALWKPSEISGWLDIQGSQIGSIDFGK